MPDLTFANLAAKLPTGAVIEDAANNDVRISLKALTGETTIALGDQKVSESISKLLDGCVNAQDSYNETATADLNAFPAASAGIPTRRDDGRYYATFTYTVSVDVPLDRDQATAALL